MNEFQEFKSEQRAKKYAETAKNGGGKREQERRQRQLARKAAKEQVRGDQVPPGAAER
jgi:hypothetical protein